MVISPVTGSLFAPFFFPLGIAFMGAQSAVMMKMAGENWQYGKRRISAMKNEEFNALTPLKLYQLETAELQSIIPTIESSLRSMTPLTATIVTEMINTFKVGAQATLSYLNDIADTPIGKVIMFAIKVWMPWMEPLLGSAVQDIIKIEEAEIIPTPDITPPSPTPKTDKEKQVKVIATLEKHKENIPKQEWQTVVGSGKTRTQVISAIKYFQLLIDQTWRDLKSVPTSDNKRVKIKKDFIAIQEANKTHYKNALSWLNKQSTAGAKTP